MARRKKVVEEDGFGHLTAIPNAPLIPPRPDDFDELPVVVQRYILFLESKREEYEQDGLVGMYHSLNSQLNKLSREIRDANVRFSDNKDSKIFERFLAANKEIRTMLENIDWLRQKLGIKEDVKEAKEKRSPIETRAK